MIWKIVKNIKEWLLPVTFHKVYLFCTILLVVSIPLSPFLLSVSQLLLVIVWLFERDFTQKIETAFKRKSVLALMFLFIMHVIWLLNTQNFSYAFHDIKIKLPLLALPLIYGTIPAFSSNQINLILKFFLSAIVVSSIYSLLIFLGLTNIDPIDYRYISDIISHIRLALLIVLSIVICLHLILSNNLPFYQKQILVAISIWLGVFLIILGSLTGIFILALLFPLGLIYFSFRIKKKAWRWSLVGIALSYIVIVNLFLAHSVVRYQKKEVVDFKNLEKQTVNGNAYKNHPNQTAYENGYFVWKNICQYELRKEWNAISEMKYDSLDRKGQILQFTLVRYLTSLGYNKDSLAISKLSDKDIEMIENGYTNCLCKNKFSLYPRLYEVFWEIDEYKKSGNPSGHSITQRFEYLKTGLSIVKEYPVFGVGSGDVEDVYQNQYKIMNSPLHPEWRRRAHNQFVTFMISFGLVGFLFFLFILIYPVYYEWKNTDFLFWGFYFIALLSMMNEDTLETQAGATFYAFFLSLFLLARNKKNES